MDTTSIPKHHLQILQSRPFKFACATGIFPPDELAVLTELGNLMEALADGTIAPETPEEQHFVQVDRDLAAPGTVCERAWVRLKGRREFEREEAQAPLPPAREDYDIVEWDADRCWW